MTSESRAKASEAALKVGFALIGVGIVLLMLMYVPWSAIPEQEKPLAVILAGILVIASGLAMAKIEGLVPLYSLKLASAIAMVFAALLILSSVLSFSWFPLVFHAKAAKSSTFQGSLYGVSEVLLSYEEVSSEVIARPWSRNEYLVNVTVEVHHLNFKGAQELLEKVNITVSTSKEDSTLRIELETDMEGIEGALFFLVFTKVEVLIPQNVSLSLSLDITSANVRVEDLRMEWCNLDLVNAQVVLENVTASEVNCEVTNGKVTVFGLLESGFVELTNGEVVYEVNPVGSSALTIDVTNGRIKLGVREGEGVGYRISAAVSFGEVDVSLPEGFVVSGSTNSKTVETEGYGSAATKVLLDLHVTNGEISIFEY